MLPLVAIGVVALLLFMSKSGSASTYQRAPGGAAAPGGGLAPGGGGVRPGSFGGGIAPGFGTIALHIPAPAAGPAAGPEHFPGLVVPGGGAAVAPIAPPLHDVPAPTAQTALVITNQTGAAGQLAIRSDPHVTFPNVDENVVGWLQHGETVTITGDQVGDLSNDPALSAGWFPVLQGSTGIAGFSAAEYLMLQFPGVNA